MADHRWKRYAPAAAVAALVLAAFALRFPGDGPLRLYTNLRTAIFLALFIAWGVSAAHRIVQPHIRRIFIAITLLMVFWMAARTVKFSLPDTSALGRYCWYLYYPPMLIIPLLTTLTAAQLGRPESYHLPKWTRGLYLTAVCLALLVLTNDLHQKVFVFPTDFQHYVDGIYKYGPGFVPIALWRYGGLLGTLGFIFARSRLPGKGRRILAPIVPAVLLSAYHICYLMEFPWLREVFGDLTATECLLTIAILECCMGTGLIQSNKAYDELTHLCGIPMVIVDRDYAPVIASDAYQPLPADTLRSAEAAPVELGDGIRLSSAPLKEGRVLWEDDISGLTAMRQELEGARERLRRRNAIQAEEYRTLRRRQDLVEKNRLYDLMQRQTAPKAEELTRLLEELEGAANAGEDRLLARAALLGAYIKRRNNLALLSESQNVLPAAELKNCLDESLRTMDMFGVEAGQRFVFRGEMGFERMIRFYEVFETVAEAALDSLTELLVTLSEREGAAVMTLRLCCGEDLGGLSCDGLSVHEEDEGEWLAVFALPEGGEAA